MKAVVTDVGYISKKLLEVENKLIRIEAEDPWAAVRLTLLRVKSWSSEFYSFSGENSVRVWCESYTALKPSETLARTTLQIKLDSIQNTQKNEPYFP